MSVTENVGADMGGAGLAVSGAPDAEQAARQRSLEPDRVGATLRYLKRNPSIVVGMLMLISLTLFAIVGRFFVNMEHVRPLSVMAIQPPSAELPFGSDRQGRDLFAVMVAGTPLTVQIGVTAGVIGVVVGTLLAFVAAFYGGLIDTLVRGMVDIGLTIPGLLVLIILAVTIRQGITVTEMALVVSCLAWLYPTRVIRSQVLSMRERSWVQVARLSGLSGPEIIFKEMLPNLFPYLAAALVTSVSNAVLASIGLEVLGLGPIESPTLGMTIYWVQFNAALLNGWWWWWVPPIVILFILFVGLFLVSLGLDEIANPRLRRSV
jgi:peptide/nickel transport system permease protein